MKLKPVVATLFALGLVASGSALAAAGSKNANSRLDNMQAKLNQLESLVNQNQYGGYEGVSSWADKVRIGGILAVDGVYFNRHNNSFQKGAAGNTNGNHDSDLNLSKGAFYVDFPVASNWVNGHVEMNYDHNLTANDTNSTLSVQEAYVTLGNLAKSPFYAKLGKQFLNFGRNDRMQIVKPMTQVMSETVATAATFGALTTDGIYGSVSVAQGLSKRLTATAGAAGKARTRVNNFVLDGGFSPNTGNKDMTWRAGASYMYNMANVDGVKANANNNSATETMTSGYRRRVGALAVYGNMTLKQFDMSAQFVSAMHKFSQNDMSRDRANSKGARPWAYMLDAGMHLQTMNMPSRVGVRWEQSGEASGLNPQNNNGTSTVAPAEGHNVAKSRWAVNYGVQVFDNTTLAAQLWHDKDYAKDKNNGSNRSSNAAALRLAVNF